MSRTSCPHGLPPAKCEICKLTDPAPVLHARERRPAGRRGLPGGIATVAVVAVVGFVVIGWVAAAFFAVLRILELLAVAVVAGWAGWKLGTARGRRGP